MDVDLEKVASCERPKRLVCFFAIPFGFPQRLTNNPTTLTRSRHHTMPTDQSRLHGKRVLVGGTSIDTASENVL